LFFLIVRNLKAPRAKIKHVTDILEQFVVPVASFIGDNFIFQHDNARLHSVRIVSEYLDEVGIASMQWPARSQDLNLIENLWDMMGQRVRALGEQIIADVLSTINSMGRGCEAVIRARGGNTPY
jgi:hypothetical protein